MLEGISILWLAVLKYIRLMCGTTVPTNAMGPQNAVMLPAKMLVLVKITIRHRRIFTPNVFALFSPNNNTFSVLELTIEITKPTKMLGKSTQS